MENNIQELTNFFDENLVQALDVKIAFQGGIPGGNPWIQRVKYSLNWEKAEEEGGWWNYLSSAAITIPVDGTLDADGVFSPAPEWATFFKDVLPVLVKDHIYDEYNATCSVKVMLHLEVGDCQIDSSTIRSLLAAFDGALRRIELSNIADAPSYIMGLRLMGCLLYTSPSPRD